MAEEMVLIEIRDNAGGISEADIKNVFAPFFTTKDPGTATGMSLSVSQGIVQEHGGILEIHSEGGQTTVSIRLPHKSLSALAV